MTTTTHAPICQCEHANHFDVDYAPDAYVPYGHTSPDVTAYVTEYGTYDLCRWCWDVCHHAVYPMAPVPELR